MRRRLDAQLGRKQSLLSVPARQSLGVPWKPSNSSGVRERARGTGPSTSASTVEADVAFGAGAFLVAYSRYNGTDWDIHATRLSSTGTVLGEVAIADAPRDQRAPAVAFDGSEFLVAWQDARADTSIGQNTDIYAARVDGGGQVLDTSSIPAATASTPDSDVDVAYDGSQFVVAWYASRNASFIGDGDIRAARVGAGGVLLDGDPSMGGFAVNTTDRSKGHPRVARFGGGVLVVWDSQDYSTSAAGILGARVDQSGNLLDGDAGGEGLWLSPVPSPSRTSRFVLPELAAMEDRLLLAYVDNVETSGETKSVAASMMYPW